MGDQDAAKVSRAVKSGTVVALLFTSVFVATLFTKSADAQNGCDNGDNGVIRLPNNINGQITICPAIGRQVPAMERQLNQILALEKSESASTADFTRLLKGLNNVSHNIGRDRQTELLKSLVAQLSASQKESDDALATKIAGLADRLDGLTGLLIEKLSNEATARRTSAELSGSVGDAIAVLDTEKATALLEGIQAKLSSIGSEVSQVHGQTTAIQETLEQQRAEEARKQQLEEDQAREAADEREHDPNTFALISLQAGREELYIFVGRPGVAPFASAPPFYDPTLRLVFRDPGGSVRLATVIDRQQTTPETWRYNWDHRGSTVAVCFAARDSINKTLRRQVTARFKVMDTGSRTALIPDGNPVLSTEDNRNCDGVGKTNSTADVPRIQFLLKQFIIRAYPSQSPNGRWRIAIRGVGRLSDARLQLSLTRGTRASLLNVPVPGSIDLQFQAEDVLVDDVGDQVVACLSGRSGESPRQVWRQAYRVETQAVGERVGFLNLVPSSQPTVTTDSGGPCR